MSPWIGWSLHVLAGAVVLVVVLFVPAPYNAFLAAAAVGFAHELGDGDFRKARGGPSNGLWDWWYFVAGSGLAYLTWMIFR